MHWTEFGGVQDMVAASFFQGRDLDRSACICA